MKLRWMRRKEDPRGKDLVGLVYLEVHAGRFHLQAQAPLSSVIRVDGETLDDLHYDIDYAMARMDVATVLRRLADDCENNSELIDAFEAE